MKIYVPDYYNDFRCIKDKCKHSCCIGWEIDIDEDTLDYYKSVKGDFGRRLSDNISYEDTPHFILGEKERCPFLNSSNLCDIYINLGKEHLCEICSNHPRFVNVFSQREEWGLGMCCEAAANIILNKKSPVKMICNSDESKETEEFEKIIEIRDRIVRTVQDRNKNTETRLDDMIKDEGVDFFHKDFVYWKEVFLNLEILDDKWKDVLNTKGKPDYKWIEQEDYQLMLEQLAVYYLQRYINKENEDNLKGWISFCYLCVYMIKELFSRIEEKDKNTFEDLCRMYSSEIEYSLDNVDEIVLELM